MLTRYRWVLGASIEACSREGWRANSRSGEHAESGVDSETRGDSRISIAVDLQSTASGVVVLTSGSCKLNRRDQIFISPSLRSARTSREATSNHDYFILA